MQRFYDPTEGRVLLDGTDLKDINVRDLRSCIGVVSQEPLLFDTTIEANIRYGREDSTFDEVVQAAEVRTRDFFYTSCLVKLLVMGSFSITYFHKLFV